MNLIKTSLLNGVAAVVKIVTLLGLNKILALYVGPSGYAAIGQLQNALTMITTLSSGAVNTGVTKYTAEHADDDIKLQRVWKTASSLALGGSAAVGVLVAVFSQHLSMYFFSVPTYGSVFIWVACSLFFFTFNALLTAILNGKKEVKKLVAANILGSLLSLAVTGMLAWQFGLYGALIALGIYQALAFFVTVFLCMRSDWFGFRKIFGRVDKAVALNLSKYAAMALTSALCLPAAQILIRNHLSFTFGIESAGYWEAMWRLSSAYLMLVTTTLSVYYLPCLSELKTAREIVVEIIAGYKVILPVAVLCCGIVFVMRSFIIKVLFSSDFLPMEQLFLFQLVGDILKIASWLLAFVMLSKAMYKTYIVTEILFSVSFYGLTVLLTDLHGLRGVVEAYAVNYAIYWVVMAIVLKSNMKANINSEHSSVA